VSADLDLGFLAGHRLAVYMATWCPDCRRLERWLAASGVAHETIDIDHVDGAAAKLEEETGKRAVPFVLVDDASWVRGYHKELPGRFDPRVLVAELQSAVKR
jgi:glutaredoxin